MDMVDMDMVDMTWWTNATQPLPLLDTVDNWVPVNSQWQWSIIVSDMPSALDLIFPLLDFIFPRG